MYYHVLSYVHAAELKTVVTAAASCGRAAMQTGIRTAFAAGKTDAFKSVLPSWVDQHTCVVSEPMGFVKLTFHCCSSTNKVQVTVRAGRSCSESASKLAAAITQKHSGCQPIHKGAAARLLELGDVTGKCR